MRKKSCLDPNLIRARCLYVRRNIMRATPAQAASAMGYKTTAQISKMETENSLSINHSYIQRLADWAAVSTDFIYGRSRYAESDPQTVEQIAVFHCAEQFVQEALKDFSKMLMSSVEVNSLAWRLQRIDELFRQVKQSWERLFELNPDFAENIRGGAKVQRGLSLLENELVNTTLHVEKIQRDGKRLKSLESALEDEQENSQIDFVGLDYLYGYENDKGKK